MTVTSYSSSSSPLEQQAADVKQEVMSSSSFVYYVSIAVIDSSSFPTLVQVVFIIRGRRRKSVCCSASNNMHDTNWLQSPFGRSEDFLLHFFSSGKMHKRKHCFIFILYPECAVLLLLLFVYCFLVWTSGSSRPSSQKCLLLQTANISCSAFLFHVLTATTKKKKLYCIWRLVARTQRQAERKQFLLIREGKKVATKSSSFEFFPPFPPPEEDRRRLRLLLLLLNLKCGKVCCCCCRLDAVIAF